MPRRFDDVVRQLTDEIVGGALPQGSFLPPAERLAQRLGASRGVVREAVRALEARGLLGPHPGRGVVVRHSDRWPFADPSVIVAMIERGGDGELLGELIAHRAELERHAATDVAALATAGDLELLRERLELIERALEERAAAEEEASFHHTLTLLGGNRVRAAVAEPLHRALATLRARDAPGRGATMLRHHRRILEGVSSRDPTLATEGVDGYARALARWLASSR